MTDSINIKTKAFNGVIWNYINKFGMQLLQLIPMMILARLLSPSEFGIVALSTIYTSFILIFVDSGFASALIQKQDLKQIDICSVFYFNIAISIIIYIISFFLAPFVASFFHMSELTAVIRVASLGLIIGAFGAIHGTLFTKELEFKKPTIRNLISYIVAACFAIVLAIKGFGYWALVIQSIVSVSLICVFNWILSSWRPSFHFSFSSLKCLFGFGSKLMLKSLSDFGFGKIYDISIGRLYSPAELSYYNRANSTSNLFTDTFLMVLNSVAFPSFSKMQDNFYFLRKNILRFFLIETMIISFIMMMLITFAEPIIHFLYSSKWDVVIPLFQLLCVWGLFRPISCIFANGLMAYGYSGLCLKNSFIGRGLNIVFLLFTWQYGLKIMILGQVIAYIFEIILYAFSFNKIFHYNFTDLIKDIIPYFCISFIVNFLVFCYDRFILLPFVEDWNNEILVALIRLVPGVFLGLFLFLFINKRIKMKAYIDFRNVLFDVFKERLILHRLLMKIF